MCYNKYQRHVLATLLAIIRLYSTYQVTVQCMWCILGRRDLVYNLQFLLFVTCLLSLSSCHSSFQLGLGHMPQMHRSQEAYCATLFFRSSHFRHQSILLVRAT